MKRTLAIVLSILLLGTLATGLAGAGETTQPLTSANAQKQETSFGDLVADALCQVSGATIALVPAVSFKSGTIPPGPVTLANVKPLLTKYSEVWAVSRLSGAQLRAALERSVSRAPNPNSGFLQVSGLSLTYNPEEPRDQRIVSLLASGAEVQPDAQYQVAMPVSLAKGGSGYFEIFGEDDIATTGSDEMAALIVAYVEAQGTVAPTGQGRINVGQ